jgi:NADH-quinone oxidoreductase subunit J
MAETASPGIVFWFLSAVVLIAAFLVVSLRNIFHCAIALIVCLSGVAGIFILLHAEFLAAAQVLIYVGAISVLMIFAIMLTSDLGQRHVHQTNHNALIAFFLCLLFAVGVWGLLKKTDIWDVTREALPAQNSLAIGKLLMTKFMLPFEVVSILLLAAIIGAIVLARGEKS